MLEGTGKRLRQIKIFNETEITEKRIKNIISDAITEIKVSLPGDF
jgi:hypothetical protein